MESNISKSQIKEELRKRWTGVAVEQSLMGHWDQAVQTNLQILELIPSDIQARNRLGKAYFELARYEEAVEVFEQNLQQQPSNAIARKMLTGLYALLHREPKTELVHIPEPEELEFEDDDEEEVEDQVEEDEPDTGSSEEGVD